MTRSRILKIKLFVFLLMFLITQVVVCDATFRKSRDSETPTPPDQNNNSSSTAIADSKVVSKQNVTRKIQIPDDKALESNKTISSNITSKTGENPENTLNISKTVQGHSASLDAGAFRRGFYVLIGLTILIVAYFVFRSFRVSNTRAQMIRKYGILAHKQDVEMRPLPLDEDDEDDTTVFDASNMSVHSKLYANS